jgi:glyoxylase-like metal-dependent hydrolase (beta-lactamase superfamily II)
MLFRDTAKGVHRVEDAFTNPYIVEGDDGLTAGCLAPGIRCGTRWPGLGIPAANARALGLTHAHFDHVGFTERARTHLGIPVYVHEGDVPLTRHPWRYDHERARARYFASQPRALRIVATFLRHRAFWP